MKVANQSSQQMSLHLSTSPNNLLPQPQHPHPQSYYTVDKNREKIEAGTLQNGQITKFQFEKLVKIQSTLSFTVAISIFLTIAAMQIERNSASGQYKDVMTFCLTFNCANTLIAMIISIVRFKAMLNLQINRKDVYQNATIFSTRTIILVVFECLVIIVQPYPFFEQLYFETQNVFRDQRFLFPVNDLLEIISLTKTYIIFRGLLLLTPYMNNRSNRLCKMYGCKANFSFSLKCLFKDNPLLLIIVLFSASSLIFSYAVYLAQRNLTQPSLCLNDVACSFQNSLWLILMTITTVGYGDYFPQTPLGRLIIFFVAIWGTFIVSIMVVVVANTLKMEKKEKEASIVIRKLAVREELRQVAARFVGYSILKMMAKSKNNEGKMLQCENEIKNSKKEFSFLRRQLKKIRNDNDLYDELASKFLNLNSDIDILNANQQKIINFIHDKLEYHQQDKDTLFKDLTMQQI